MIILGLSAYHGDSAACIIKDGKLVSAIEEERLRRLKHWAGLPTEAIQACLREAGAGWKDVSHIALNRKPNVHIAARLAYIIRRRPDLGLLWNKVKNLGRGAAIRESLQARFGPSHAQLHYIEHHEAHLASAYLASDLREAAVVSVDAMGDFASAAWGVGDKNDISIHGRVLSPHSLGIFYSAITQFIGFPYFGDEYKVMGLAPYGEPKFLALMREIVRVQADGKYELNLRYFRHHRENFKYTWNDCIPEVGTLYSEELEELLGPARGKEAPLEQRHKDLARSAQAMYEEAFFALLNAIQKQTNQTHLALAGGCALNSVANGKIHERSAFKKIYIPPAAGDAGGCIGAALTVLRGTGSSAGRCEMRHGYWGPQFSDEEMESLTKARRGELEREGIILERAAGAPQLCASTARAIADGKVVGWFQGRMEWGPRALGNRSIVCDPRRGNMKDILNLKIKRRESFRPFAPSILRERVAEWFETDADVPFMMQVYQIRPEKRPLIPAVTHVDGSGRLQTVHQDTNPRYHLLISEFENLTGVPLVLNTSFNENEPVVCRPQEALECFLRTKMDWLVLGSTILRRD